MQYVHNGIKKEAIISDSLFIFFCEPAGTRTQDPYIKSVMLYQLSYEFNFLNIVINSL